MGPVDYLLIAAVAAALVWAVWVIRRNRKNGKTCSGDCASCGRSCGK